MFLVPRSLFHSYCSGHEILLKRWRFNMARSLFSSILLVFLAEQRNRIYGQRLSVLRLTGRPGLVGQRKWQAVRKPSRGGNISPSRHQSALLNLAPICSDYTPPASADENEPAQACLQSAPSSFDLQAMSQCDAC